MNPGAELIRILVADDERLFRAGLRLLLERVPAMRVVAEAATGADAVAQYALHRPDVTLLDLRFPDMCGVEAIRAIREQFLIARVVVLTACEGDEDVYQSLRAGARAYLSKDATPEELIDCIERVHRGERIVAPPAAAKLAERTAGPGLTDRELAVLRLIVAGRSNKEIAADLRIGEGTVKTHVKHVLDKLGVQDRTQAVTTALRRGFVQMD
jgi:two-component system NarL family response regulator